MIVYVSIGNSDDKLTHAEWAEYVRLAELANANPDRIGEWYFNAAVWLFHKGVSFGGPPDAPPGEEVDE